MPASNSLKALTRTFGTFRPRQTAASTVPNQSTMDPVASTSRVALEDAGGQGLVLSNLPKSTLAGDISRFLHPYGSRSQHIQQVTLLLNQEMRFKGAALVAFHSAETCRRVHEALLEVYRKANQPPLRIGLSSPLTFQRVHLSHQPWSEIATNQGGGGRYRSWLVDGQKRFFGRTVAIHGFTEDVNPAQVLNLVKGTGVQPIPTAPNAARPGEFVQSVPYVFLFYRSVCN